jgi:hypothetical protein
LKKGKYFLPCIKNDDSDKEFIKCIRRNRVPRDIRNFLEQNILQEKQYEWYLQFDPIDTEKRRKVYGSMI